ncbi:NAD-dependent epimerase/dehydratase family protein [Pengzhenrongella frigida]|uniref:NAD-dependent epimerase/dehydratase family protein n=1 Tax=Pengzhenrongella frigida TaxID=1259133 RepID=A0A4Q5N240_9MICO|nr:NAD-dependent epimerase/dehydratase family protein [Cellulomonas sp. HLT2-17]RYV52190.1 NAD-dependent epimerase/dehydratase family protein [Cellulomonas sp. HLT2-17]
MRLLVIGGTGWLGGTVVRAALARGDEVTTLTRGRTAPAGSPRDGALRGVRALVADRADPADVDRALTGRTFDAVVDTAGYSVAGVRTTAAALADVGHYAYVSSISAYRDWPPGPIQGTGDPTFAAAPGADPEAEPAGYGPMKAASERALAEVFGDRLLLARSGLIVGPGDPTGRLGWWLRRIARGGDVVVPASNLEAPVAFVDVRDLADWLVDGAHRQVTGAVNASGDAGMTTYGGLLEACRTVVGADADRAATWVPLDDAMLLAAGVEEWTHLPFWSAGDAARTLWQVDTTSARAAGLASRPIVDTLRDTWSWLRDQPPAAATPVSGRPPFGLPAAIEHTLLDARRRRPV